MSMIMAAGAAEEFHESDVIFAADDHDDSYKIAGCSDQLHRIHIRNSGSGNKMARTSLPVNIPSGAKVFRCRDELDVGGEMEPPHVILGRRIGGGGEMAFSVCSGNGRTLKGRDLSRVRNSVLRMTGFLET